MSYAAVAPDNTLIALMTAPADVQSYAKVLTGTEAKTLAVTRELRCGRSGCDAPIFYRGGSERTPHFYHSSESMGTCDELKGGMTEWHLKMQFSVFAHAFSQEWRMQGAIADVVVQRKNPNKTTGIRNKFAVEIQHSPISRETVLARHAAHVAAGLMGTVWIVDGAAFKSKNRRIHTSWVLDLIQACMETPGGYPCTVLVYKDKRGEERGSESVSIIESVELDHESDGRRYAVANLVKDEGTVVRLSMGALGFLAQGPKRPDILPADVRTYQKYLDSLPTRRIRNAIKINEWAAAA